MTKTYIAKLNSSELTDLMLEYFEKKGIKVLKHYPKLEMLHISCDDALAEKKLKYLTIIEEEETFEKAIKQTDDD